MPHLRHSIPNQTYSHNLWGPEHTFRSLLLNIISRVTSTRVPLCQGAKRGCWGLQMMEQLLRVVMDSEGVHCTDGPQRVGRDSEGVMTASEGVVSVSELIVRASKRMVRAWERVVGVSGCDREKEKEIPICIGTIDYCHRRGCYPKREKMWHKQFFKGFQMQYRWSLHDIHSLRNFDSNGCIWEKS